MQRKNIIIIGAGIAGLTAAKELADHHNILIIEAAPKAGGRIMSQTIQDVRGIIEGGAEFIHGNLKHTLQLLKEAGLEYIEVEGKFYGKEENQLQEQREMVEGWDKLLHKMKHAEKNSTMADFLQQHFAGEEHAALRKHAVAFAEGFDVADIAKVSVNALYEEWSHEEDTNYRIPAGYGAVIDHLLHQCEQKGCSFVFNNFVKQVDWEKNEVTVYTADQKKYNAEKLITTISLGILQQAAAKASINFTPPLDHITKAAAQMGFGTVIKIALLFKECFWPKDAGFIFSDESIPTWWTQLPDERSLLTGWCGGPKATALGESPEDAIVQQALRSLSNIFNIPPGELQTQLQWSAVFNWQQNEYAAGAYSYATPHTDVAIKELTTPVDDTLFFCGEALYTGEHPGTVEAAIVSAKETVQRIEV